MKTKILNCFRIFLLFIVEESLPVEERFIVFHMVVIRHAAVYRAYGSALGLIMKTLALGALIGHNVVNIVRYGCTGLIGVYLFACWQHHAPAQAGTILVPPVICAFIDGRIGAFGLTGTAVYAFVCYNDSHSLI